MGTGTTTECGSAEGTMWANYIPSYKTRGACLGRLHARQCHDVLSRVGVFFSSFRIRLFGPDGKKNNRVRLHTNKEIYGHSHYLVSGDFF